MSSLDNSFPSLSQPLSLPSAPQSIPGSFQVLPPSTVASRQKRTRARRGKPADAGQSRALERLPERRPLTPRLPTASCLPIAPVDVSRRLRHAAVPSPLSLPLSPLLQRVPDAARLGQWPASHARAPEPSPLSLLLPGTLLHPHERRGQLQPLSNGFQSRSRGRP